MNEQTLPAWTVTDEEWSQLSFMVVELRRLQDQLEGVLLGDERPSLRSIYGTVSAYQASSTLMFDYFGDAIRERVGIQDRPRA
ncbi:MAG: hypothetical protein NVS4B8_07560 [Herpetosiphon sp.]